MAVALMTRHHVWIPDVRWNADFACNIVVYSFTHSFSFLVRYSALPKKPLVLVDRGRPQDRRYVFVFTMEFLVPGILSCIAYEQACRCNLTCTRSKEDKAWRQEKGGGLRNHGCTRARAFRLCRGV